MEWQQEACDLRDDPVSGARIIKLTSGPMINNNIYCEQPYCSPDGKRIAIARCSDFNFAKTGVFLVFDLERLRLGWIDDIMGPRQLCTNAWSGKLYYWTPDRVLKRGCLTDLTSETVYVEEDPEVPLIESLASVSPDQRYMLGMQRRMHGPGVPVFQMTRLDMEKGVREVILEHPELCNAHLQYNPFTGEDILVQNNRGVRLKPDGTVDRAEGDEAGTGLFVIDGDGGNLRDLPAGPPQTASCTGHECFVGNTGKVLFSVCWDIENDVFDSRYEQGNVFTAKPGDAEPTVFVCPEHKFSHISASRCGRYFVADSYSGKGLFKDGQLQPKALVIANLQTGKYRTLVQDSMASTGGNQCTHTHPYLTTDNSHVIFNADPYQSVPQVFAAKVPEGFLDSLE